MCKKSLFKFLLPLFVFGPITLFANTSCFHFVSKGGVTFYDYFDCRDTLAGKQELESFLDFILQHIERKDDNLQILIFRGFCYCDADAVGASYSNFEIGDTVFGFERQYENKTDTTFSNYYPYDVVSTVYGDKIPSGLIIRFVFPYHSTKDDRGHDRILSIVNFAIRNIETIKDEQKYLRVRGYVTGETISILTYDTAKLNAIKTENYGFVKGKDYSNKTRNLALTILAGMALISTAFFIAGSKKKANARIA
ncbi:MAG: hypothetical protein V4722_12725 [Bacteroidota bacterium]